MENRESCWSNSGELREMNSVELSWTSVKDSRGSGLRNQKGSC
jgi:hypothetical protein